MNKGVKQWLKAWAKRYAESKNFKLNPDEKIVDSLIEGLLRNKEKYSYFYCPCRTLSGDIEKDRLKICPCKWHIVEIKRDGHCHCQLFVSRDYKKDK